MIARILLGLLLAPIALLWLTLALAMANVDPALDLLGAESGFCPDRTVEVFQAVMVAAILFVAWFVMLPGDCGFGSDDETSSLTAASTSA